MDPAAISHLLETVRSEAAKAQASLADLRRAEAHKVEELLRAAEAANPEEVAERLEAFMVEINLGTVAEFADWLAKETGDKIGRTAVSNWLQGYRAPPIRWMLALTRRHPVSLEWIYAGTVDPTNPLELRLELRVAEAREDIASEARSRARS